MVQWFWKSSLYLLSTNYQVVALYMYTDNNVCNKLKGNFMKLVSALIATMFAATAFAQAPAAKKEEAKPAVTVAAPAPAATAPAKKDEKKATKEAAKTDATKSAPAVDKKAEAPKK
jgi:hypothetical protein